MRENFLKDFLDILLIKNMFKMIRAINRTDSRSIWTRLGEDIDHIGKIASNPPLKKEIPTCCLKGQQVLTKCENLKDYHLSSL